MFQATGLMTGHQRPAIMHAYGGAKVGMDRALAIATEGWIPMAAAMLGTANRPPMWASAGLRPVAGTTIDFRVLPPALSEREMLLLLSSSQQWDPTSVSNSALSQWLIDIDVDKGPDGQCSPTFLKPNFNAQQLIYTKLPTCPHWKISRNMALIQKLSASLRCESSRMSILLKPFWQSTFSRQQDTSLIISPMD